MFYRILFLAFFIVPLVEVWILVEVGSVIGAPPLVALVVLTAFTGAFFLRGQALSTFLRAQRDLADGKLPAQQLLEGAMLLVAGALLLTPGFATDAVGFALIIAPVRERFAGWLFRAMSARAAAASTQWEAYEGRDPMDSRETPRQPSEPHISQTIEGEYTRGDD